MHDLLGYQLAQASIVTTVLFERTIGVPFKLRPVEFTILQLVRSNTDVTLTRLARALAISTPAMKVWLDKLEQRQLLRREPSSSDGRSQQLRLTADGTQRIDAAMAQVLKADQALAQGLSAAEQAMLLELLRKVGHQRSAISGR